MEGEGEGVGGEGEGVGGRWQARREWAANGKGNRWMDGGLEGWDGGE